MAELKRDVVKYVRDKAKTKYEKGTECFICGETESLDFHHFYSMTPLLTKWMKEKKHDPKYILSVREDFIEDHHKEIYEETVTLCHTHHLRLHAVYGKNPSLVTALKQKRWAKIQRDKHGVV